MTFSPNWSHTSPGTKLAALANGGTFVESGGSSQWFTNAGSPVWSTVPGISFQPKIDAGADTLACLRFEMESATSPRIPTLRRFTPAGPAPTFTYKFPFAVQNTASGVHVSRDGQTIAAWVFDYSQQRTIVSVFSAAGVTRSQAAVHTLGLPFCSALSTDGSTLLLVSQITRARVNTNTGQITLEYNTTNIGLSCAIDGGMYAVAESQETCSVWRGGTLSSINPTGTSRCVSVRLGANTYTGWSDGKLLVDATVIQTPGPMVDMDVSPDGNTIACAAGGVTILERTGTSSFAKTFEQNIVGATDVDVSNDLVSVVAGTKVEVFKRGAAPSGPTEYRCTIPAPAVQGTVHTASAFPVGSGAPISVRVL